MVVKLNKNTLIIIAIVLIVIAGFFLWDIFAVPVSENQELTSNAEKIDFPDLGISFVYQNNYNVFDGPISTAQRGHFRITLIPKDFITPIDGEGPPSINLDFYQNNLDRVSIDEWVRGNNNSNFKLGNGTCSSTTVAGIPALQYNWDGLYPGYTIVFEHSQNIIAVSVTYLDQKDQIRRDFNDIVKSIQLYAVRENVLSDQTRIENYLKENISRISPEKEVLGGKFYLTEVKLTDAENGVVSYEDGHVAFTADFTYTISRDGRVTIDTFRVRK